MELIDKLKLKKDKSLLFVGIPAQLAGLFNGFMSVNNGGGAMQVVCFCRDAQAFRDQLPGILASSDTNAVLWFMYPKKSGNIPTDMSRDNGWELLHDAGYEPVTSVAIDSDWTGLRFKKKQAIEKHIREVPVAERQAEGIDFKNRAVHLPGDVLLAISRHEGLTDYFDSLAFTHKKEHILAIVEAKKPETRARRIDNMISKLLQKMQGSTKK